MKKILYLLNILLVIMFTSCKSDNIKEHQITLTNNLNTSVNDYYVEVDLEKIWLENIEGMNFIVTQGNEEIPSQRIGNEKLAIVVSFLPNEEKVFTITYGKDVVPSSYLNRTYAEIAMKVDYEKIDGKYTGGKFQTFNKLSVPLDHTDHNALFKYEGPGWESELVGYRLYIDWRNRTDIFGKKIYGLVLKDVGVNDIYAKDDSYHNMQEWGKDLFKVGNSLGIGSFGMFVNDEIVMVSERDSVTVEISQNGPVKSTVEINYFGWKVKETKYDLNADFSITAGSRLTEVNLSSSNQPDNFVTGFAKHDNTVFSQKITDQGWSYISLFGEQVVPDANKPDEIVNDKLGIAVLFNSSDLISQTESNDSHVLILKPTDGQLQYYFTAAWEMEPNGFKTQQEFENYLDKEIELLNNPITVK